MRTLNQSMINDFDPENVAQLATYVSEVVTAIQNGQEVGQEDVDNLKKILQFVQDLDSVGAPPDGIPAQKRWPPTWRQPLTPR